MCSPPEKVKLPDLEEDSVKCRATPNIAKASKVDCGSNRPASKSAQAPESPTEIFRSACPSHKASSPDSPLFNKFTPIQFAVGVLSGSCSAMALHDGSDSLGLAIPIGLAALQILDYGNVIKMPWNDHRTYFETPTENQVIKKVAMSIIEFSVKNAWIVGGFFVGAAGYEYYVANKSEISASASDATDLSKSVAPKNGEKQTTKSFQEAVLF